MTARLTGHRRGCGTFLPAGHRIVAKGGGRGRSPEAGRKLPPACRSPYPTNQRGPSANPPQERFHVR